MNRRRVVAVVMGLVVLVPTLGAAGGPAGAQPEPSATSAGPNGKDCGGDGQPSCPPVQASTNCKLPASQGGQAGVADDGRCDEMFALPAWSDAARFDQPQHYDTIQVADVNGNGQPDLVALSSQGLELYELSPDHGACGQQDVPFLGCGTWVPLNDRGQAYGFATDNGLFASSLVHTGDLDGDGADEILVGDGTDLLMVELVPAPLGPGGVPDGTLGTLSKVATGPAIDAAGGFDGSDWSQPQYRTTITIADFDGKPGGAEELVARSKSGFWVWSYSSGSFSAPHSRLNLDDGGGYDQSSYYSPVLAGDVDGDGAAELFVRGSTGQRFRKLSGAGWSSGPLLPELADSGGQDGAEYWRSQYRLTQQLADIDGDGDDELLARGATHLWSYDFVGGVWAAPVQGPPLSDVDGYASASRYSTIHTMQVVLGADPTHDGVEVIASDGSHVNAWQYDPGSKTWAKLPMPFVLPTSTDWTQPRYYEGFRTTPASTDPALNALIYRDPLGIHSVTYDETAGWDETNADFMDVSTDLNAVAYAAVNCFLEFSAGVTVRSQYDSPQIGSIYTQFASDVPTTAPDGSGGRCNGTAVQPAAWAAVRGAIDGELAAASSLSEMFTEVRWVINETFVSSEATLSKAATAIDADEGEKTTFKWGELVSGLVEGIGAALEFAVEGPFASISIFATTGASAISAGTEFTDARARETSTEIEYEELEKFEDELQARYGGSLAAIQDERAAVVQDWGEMQTMFGLSRGPWRYVSANDPYLEAAANRHFEEHMWASSVPAAGWRVYVCADQSDIFNRPSGSESSRTECSNHHGFAGATADGALPSPITREWIVDHLGTGSTPIKVPSSELVNRLFATPDPSCAANWVSYSDSDDPGCGFGLDEVETYTGHGPWAIGCTTYWQKSALVHSSVHIYPGPCDHYEHGSHSDVSFTDVGNDHPFFTAIGSLAEKGYVSGFPDGSFGPTLAVSRQTIAAVLYRMAGSPDVGDATSSFSDVGPASPFHDAITWMERKGYATGYADGTFRPAEPVSRQTAAAYLYRYSSDVTPDPLPRPVPDFVDVPSAHPFETEIEWLVAADLANGYADGTFGPRVVTSRQTMSQMLFRMWASGWTPKGIEVPQ